MSYPPHGPPPPPYYGSHYGPWPHPGHHPHGHHPPPHGHHPPPYGQYPPPNDHYPPHGPPIPYFVPATMMVPVPVAQPDPTQQQPTYITNYIYHGETSTPSTASTPAVTEGVQVVEVCGDFDWVPTTSTLAGSLTGRAVVGGHEGWDGSPLWVIRAWHNGEQIPGKLSVRHSAATIPYNGKEVPVQNIEVLCAKSESLRWVPATNGDVPPSAIPGGRSSSGETIYVGRVRYQLSLTPGKMQPSQGACYISFAGTEVAHKMYDVLCRIS